MLKYALFLCVLLIDTTQCIAHNVKSGIKKWKQTFEKDNMKKLLEWKKITYNKLLLWKEFQSFIWLFHKIIFIIF